MLTKIRLINFKCFEDHTIPLKQISIIVGKNNAGKSTIIEAIRILTAVATRYKGLNFSNVPDWLEIGRINRGVSPSLDAMDLNFSGLFYQYREPPAQIIATFQNGETIEIYLGGVNKIHALIRDRSGHLITTKGQAREFEIPGVSILPQVGPLLKEERKLDDTYLRRSLSTSHSPSHFRNQIKLLNQSYQDLKLLAEETWAGLQIQGLEERVEPPNRILELMVRDGDFVAEIGLMGHGLQMWLQTMWFLARSKGSNTVILDEPDVYMHSDLQRKLIRVVKEKFNQVIVATHSIEIMSEVNPENILVIDRKKRKSLFATTLPAVQRIVDNIGGVHNISLTRLWSAKKCLLVEGKDISILKLFQNILFPRSNYPFDIIPNMSLGGWSGWSYAVGSSLMMKNSFGEDIISYCLFDSDFHTEQDKEERYADATSRSVRLHIWKRKEIENYVIVPSAIHRVIILGINESKQPPFVSDIQVKIDQIIESQKEGIQDNYANEFYLKNRSFGIQAANKSARTLLESSWLTIESRISICSGKDLISELSNWSNSKFGVSFNAARIVRTIREDEIPQEMKSIVGAIENGTNFRK